MLQALKKNATTIVISIVVAGSFAAGPAIAAAINAKTLNGYKANQLIRVAQNSIDNNSLIGTGAEANVISTSITAPENGTLVVTASSDVYGGPDTDTCTITLDGTQLNAADRTFKLTTDNSEGNCNTDIAWPVGAGLHTLALVATNPATGVTYDESTIEVTFIPFNGSGQLPTPVPPTAPTHAGANN